MKQHTTLVYAVLLFMLAEFNMVLGITCPAGSRSGVNMQREEICTDCVPGTYSPAGASACTDCAPGYSSDAVAATCYLYARCIEPGTHLRYPSSCTGDDRPHPRNGACPPGQYVMDDGQDYLQPGEYRHLNYFEALCSLCPTGKYTAAWGKWPRADYAHKDPSTQIVRWDCLLCEVGTYQPAQGGTTCLTCTSGTYANTGASVCAACAPGKYEVIAGGTNCAECVAGTYTAEPFMTSCTECVRGKYASEKAQTQCLDCASNAFSTPTVRGTSCQTCAGNEHPYEYYDWKITFTCTSNTHQYLCTTGDECVDANYDPIASTNGELLEALQQTFTWRYVDEGAEGYVSVNRVPLEGFDAVHLFTSLNYRENSAWTAGPAYELSIEYYYKDGSRWQNRMPMVLIPFEGFSSKGFQNSTQIAAFFATYTSNGQCIPGSQFIDLYPAVDIVAQIDIQPLTGIPHTCRACEQNEYTLFPAPLYDGWDHTTQQRPCEACKGCPFPQQLIENTCPGDDGTSDGTCSACQAGYYLIDESDESCETECAAGSYRGPMDDVYSCTQCPAFTHGTDCCNPTEDSAACTVCDVSTMASRSTTATTGSKEESECICKSPLEMRIVDGDNVCQCKPGYYMDHYTAGNCILAEGNYYVPVYNTGDYAKRSCPEHSSVPGGGGTELKQCLCSADRFQVWDDTTFVCECNPGTYEVENDGDKSCQRCSDTTAPTACTIGEHLVGCAGTSPGTCEPCPSDADCPVGQTRINCGVGLPHLVESYGGEGECEFEHYLVRTPLCPEKYDEALQDDVDVPEARTALGDYDFETVFGQSYKDVAFQCRDICDGTRYKDTTICDGPFACNRKTCVQNMLPRTTASQLPPVLACPVVINSGDTNDVIQQKRNVSCVSCATCGDEVSTVPDYGLGCAKECSRLLCEETQIFDWTTKTCKSCPALQDVRLCTAAQRVEYGLQLQQVTGYLPMIEFKQCKGGNQPLDEIKYGACEPCTSALQGVTCDSTQYLASCSFPFCQVCARAGAGNNQYQLLQQVWVHLQTTHQLFCQVSACLHREDSDWTGVLAHGALCTQQCRSADTLICTAQEYILGCLLPHDTRCVQMYPLPTADVPSTVTLIHDEVNLLNEMPRLDGGQRHMFASFENTMITLGDPLYEYECVWNAAGILDNRAHPAGVSHSFWPPGQTFASEYASRGSKL